MELNKVKPNDIRINSIIKLNHSRDYKIISISGDRIKVVDTKFKEIYNVGADFILQEMYLVKRGSTIEYKKNKE